MVEWMSQERQKAFDVKRQHQWHPCVTSLLRFRAQTRNHAERIFRYAARHVEKAHRLKDLDNLGTMPKVVMASHSSLEHGPAKALLRLWSRDPRNLILLTQRPEEGTPAAALLGAQPSASSPAHIRLAVPKRVPLEGLELKAHEEALQRQAEEEERKRQEEEMARVLHREGADDDDIDDDDDDDDDDDQGDNEVEVNGGDGGEHDDETSRRIRRRRRRQSSALVASCLTTPRHDMFGCIDPPPAADDYGIPMPDELINLIRANERAMTGKRDALAFLSASGLGTDTDFDDGGDASRAGLANGNLIDELATGHDADDDDDAGGPSKRQRMIPTKIVRTTIELQVVCKVVYIDVEGRADARSLRGILSNLAPRRVVVLPSGTSAIEQLRKHVGADACFAPNLCECERVTLDTRVLHVRLDDALFRGLHFETVGKRYEVARVRGLLDRADAAAGSAMLREPQASEPDALSTGHHDPGTTGQEAPLWLSEGELHLTALKKALTEAGFKTDFRGGVKGGLLICNDRITITKPEGHSVVVDGPLCEDFYRVREAVANQFQLI